MKRARKAGTLPGVTIKKPEGEEPAPVEVIEAAIVEIAESATKLLRSRLTLTAICLLIQHETKVPRRTVAAVLQSAASLDAKFLKAPRVKP